MTQPPSRAARWRRAGVIALIAAPFVAAVPILIGMARAGDLFDLVRPAWWLILFGPTALVLLLSVVFTLLEREPGRMPALDRTPRDGTVVSHRMQSTGDSSSRRITAVEYRAADGDRHRSDLLEELTAQSAQELPPGSPVEVYAFQDPQFARTAVFLTEAHDDLVRQGIGAVLWGVNRSARFADGPVPGSPYVGQDAGEVFADPVPAEPAPEEKPHRVSARAARILVVIAWVVAGAAMLFATTFGFGAFSNDFEVSVPVVIAAFGISLGAMFLDGGTASRRGTLTRWAVVRLIGVATLGVWVGALVLLIPALWGIVRRLTGGAAPRHGQRQFRNLTGLLLSTLLITFAVVGAGRAIWWSPLTSTQASSGIGIGVTYIGAAGSDEVGEVVYVPYTLDGQPAYQNRVAAVSLEDAALLWDRRLDSEPASGFPVTVTSIDPQGTADPDDPSAQTDAVIVTTEHGEVGLYPDDGDESCGAATHLGNDCGAEPGQGVLAAVDDSMGQGADLRDGDTVLDPMTGVPAGDGFRIELDTGGHLALVADDRETAAVDGVSSLQQVLVAPSGRVVLVIRGENNKAVVVIAARDGLRQATIGDRGPVAWPAWMG